MYTKPRPIVLSCALFNNGRNGAYKAILTSAETIDELKRDIVSNTELTYNDLNKFQFTTDSYGALTNNVPLFESSAEITTVDDPRFSTYADESYFNEHANDDDDNPYLLITMSESNKLYNSGSLLIPTTIDACASMIRSDDKEEEFINRYGVTPVAASLSMLQSFISEYNVKRIQKVINESKPDPIVQAITDMTNVIKAMAQSNFELARRIESISHENNYGGGNTKVANGGNGGSKLLDTEIIR